jgi:hypothetical protein
VGSVAVRVTYSLNLSARGQSISNVVAMNLEIRDWPWQSSIDMLRATLSFSPAYNGTERLVTGGGPGSLFTSVSNRTGVPREYFVAGTQAAISGSATPAMIGVSSHLTLRSQTAQVSLTFGNQSEKFSSLNYSSIVGIVVTPVALGPPSYDYALVGGGAGLVALLVGIGVRQLRRRPSNLLYTED